MVGCLQPTSPPGGGTLSPTTSTSKAANPSPRVDAGNIVGNLEAKYDTRNPIARRMVAGFLDAVTGNIERTRAGAIYEVGCGEAALARQILARIGPPLSSYTATDVDLEPARDHLARCSPTDARLSLAHASVYDLPVPAASQELVLCCEVLEHLDDPQSALAELARITDAHIIISTPREPLWRALNMARGKYLRDLGNTPGHIQHFSRRALVELVARYFEIETVSTPIPWTIILARRPSSTPAGTRA